MCSNFSRGLHTSDSLGAWGTGWYIDGKEIIAIGKSCGENCPEDGITTIIGGNTEMQGVGPGGDGGNISLTAGNGRDITCCDCLCGGAGGSIAITSGEGGENTAYAGFSAGAGGSIIIRANCGGDLCGCAGGCIASGCGGTVVIRAGNPGNGACGTEGEPGKLVLSVGTGDCTPRGVLKITRGGGNFFGLVECVCGCAPGCLETGQLWAYGGGCPPGCSYYVMIHNP